MLVAREGKPGSGKSYELVSVDLLDNLKRGRRVYARINGLDFDAIAAHLAMPVERVRELLVTLTDEQVREWLVCDTIGDAFDFPHLQKGALVIVDECHDFWPVSRQELPERVGAFFAKHRHWGLDVALATQDMREVHRSVLRRLDKKNLYAKLDAIGRDGDYSVRHYVSPRPGAFEQMSVERRSYDKAIFPLYCGVQPGVENAGEVYNVGSKTLWQAIRKWVFLVVIALALGLFAIVRFFVSPGATVDSARPEAKKPPPAQATSAVTAMQAARLAGTDPTAAAKAAPPPPPPPPDAPGVAYIRDLIKGARPRYLGEIGTRRMVEFREKSGDRVLERMTDRQLEALGFIVVPTGYGLLATAPRIDVVFTAWPVDPQWQQSLAATQAINATPLVAGMAAGAGAGPSGQQPVASSPSYYGQVAQYGGMGLVPPAAQ